MFSSSTDQGDLMMLGESWLYHLNDAGGYLSLICLEERVCATSSRISTAMVVHCAVPCCWMRWRMISSYCVMVGLLLRSMSFGLSSSAYKMTVKIFIPS